VFVKMLGFAGLHQATVETLRTSLLSAQSEDTGGFVAVVDGTAGLVASVLDTDLTLLTFMEFRAGAYLECEKVQN